MQNATKEQKSVQMDPQESLEKVLTAEIEITSKLSDARAKADKIILEAQNNTNKLKNKIIEKARSDRDSLYKEGVQKARDESKKSIEEAKKESEKFLENGQGYLDEARDQVMALLLSLEGKAK